MSSVSETCVVPFVTVFGSQSDTLLISWCKITTFCQYINHTSTILLHKSFGLFQIVSERSAPAYIL